MFLRIVGVLIVLAAIIGGYMLIHNAIVAGKQKEYIKFAGIIAETSIAAEIYRDNSGLFLTVRDSILNRYNITLDDLADFRERMQENHHGWQIVFDYVSYITDSLVDIQMARLKAARDSAADSSAIIR